MIVVTSDEAGENLEALSWYEAPEDALRLLEAENTDRYMNEHSAGWVFYMKPTKDAGEYERAYKELVSSHEVVVIVPVTTRWERNEDGPLFKKPYLHQK